MADIFDLARSINAKKQQASQGYNSPLEDLPMQVMEIMNTRAKEKRVSLKNDSVLLSNLIKGASTGEELDNARNLANKYSTDANKHDGTKLYGEAINQQFNSKQKAYNQYVASAEWLDGQMNNRPYEKGLDSTDYGLSQINDKTWDGLANEKFGKSVGDLSDIENIDMMASISKGGSDKFKSTRGWGEWSTVQQGMDEQFLSMIDSDGFDSVAGKYNLSSDVINKINQSFDNDEDKSKALAVIIAESGGDSSAVNYNYRDKVKGKSYFKMSSQEMQELSLGDIEERIREFEGISAGFEQGSALGFKYNKGKSSYVTLQNEYEDYKQRLDDTMKAHVTGDKISGEEAMAIMLGDFDNTKAQAIKQTNSNITEQNRQYNALLALQRKNLTENDEDVWIGELGEETRGMSVDAVQDYINQKLPVALQGITNSKERLRMWTGLDTKAGKSDFINAIDDDEGAKKAAAEAAKKAAELAAKEAVESNQIVSIEGQKVGGSSTPIKPKTIKSSKVLSSKIEIPKGDAQIEAFFNSSVEPPKDPISKTIKIDNTDQPLPKITRYKDSFMYYEPKQKTWVKWDGKKANFNGKSVPVFEARGRKVAYYNDKKGEWIKIKRDDGKYKISGGKSRGLQEALDSPPIMSEQEEDKAREERSRYRDAFGNLLKPLTKRNQGRR